MRKFSPVESTMSLMSYQQTITVQKFSEDTWQSDRHLWIAIYWSTSNTSTSTSTLTTSTSTKYIISDNSNILTHPFDFDHFEMADGNC